MVLFLITVNKLVFNMGRQLVNTSFFSHRKPSHHFRIWIKWKIKLPFIARVSWFLAAFQARSTSARSGTEILEVWDSQILGGSDHSPKIIKSHKIELRARRLRAGYERFPILVPRAYDPFGLWCWTKPELPQRSNECAFISHARAIERAWEWTAPFL